MYAYDVIAAKRDGRELTDAEIRYFIDGVTTGTIPDYQISAWLMAVYLRGMNARETRDLTLAMRDSGRRLDLTEIADRYGCPVLDKHSTGGVGDKTTLVIAPILAAAGVPMLKMSGRGLGFSGGTIDKLEAIPGFRTGLGVEEARQQVLKIGAAVIAQTGDLAPADKILYALRDVTATIESIPLIAGSIMSKKLAAGGQRIVLDVKVGRGSFMPTLERAEELARMLVDIGNGAGIPTIAVLTAMDEPLGYTVGNALEVREAIRTLRSSSEAEPRFRALCIELAAHGLMAVGKATEVPAALALVEQLLDTGAALAKFTAIVREQGGPDGIDAIETVLPKASLTHPVLAESEGVVIGLDAAQVGRLAMRLGAGRATKNAKIDLAVGVELHSKIGSTVVAGQPVATLHLRAQDRSLAAALASELLTAYRIDASAPVQSCAGPILAVID
jgi:pyrimidine-nucleoside phosphorylase